MKLKSNLDTIIYNLIVDALFLGEYQMGQTILLDEFANKYEVSRTPVIQAVRLLVNDGILESMSNGRVMVPVFDREQMRKICDVRLLMEEYAIKIVVARGEQETEFFNTLEKLAGETTKAFLNDEKLEFQKRDLNFHSTLIAECGNEYLTAEYKRIQCKFIVANYLILPLEKRNFKDAARSHEELVRLIKANDLEGSLKLIKEHIYSYSAPF